VKKIVLSVFACSVLTCMTPAAYAHGDAAVSSPADGATLEKVPKEVSVTFTETPAPDSNFDVKDGCGDEIGDPSIEGKTISVAVADAQPGTWSVAWHVLSAEDGHETKDAISFTVRGKPDCSEDEPTPGQTTDEIGDAAPPVGNDTSEGIPAGLVIGGIAAVVLVGLALVVRRSSSS
jgi:copper resistance protein C